MRSRMKKLLWGLGLLLIFPETSFGKSHGTLPPIGQRIYVLGTDGGKGPVAILRDKSSRKVGPENGNKVLRDPTAVIPQKPTKSVSNHVQEQVSQAPPRERSGEIRFKKVTIPGAIPRPRIDFAQEPLRIERVDETVSADFFDKVFIPGRDEIPQ